MKGIKGLIALGVAVILSAWLTGQAAADPMTNYRAKNGAFCTADMIYRSGDGIAPFFIFKYEGPNGIASAIFRLTEYYGMPAVYLDRITVGNGTAAVYAPAGNLPVATFGPLFEFEVDEHGVPQITKFPSLFAVGADLQRTLATAVADFCEEFDPGWFYGTDSAAPTVTPTPTRTPTATPTPVPAR